MWEPCNLSRQTNANFPRFLCRDSSSMVSKKNGYICAVMYHFYDWLRGMDLYVCNNTWCDYSSTTPHNPHNSVLPLLLLGNLYIYESWYYSLCVVVYGMNIMMHIESTNYCMLSYFCSSKFLCIFQIVVFTLISWAMLLIWYTSFPNFIGIWYLKNQHLINLILSKLKSKIKFPNSIAWYIFLTFLCLISNSWPCYDQSGLIIQFCNRHS